MMTDPNQWMCGFRQMSRDKRERESIPINKICYYASAYSPDGSRISLLATCRLKRHAGNK